MQAVDSVKPHQESNATCAEQIRNSMVREDFLCFQDQKIYFTVRTVMDTISTSSQ